VYIKGIKCWLYRACMIIFCLLCAPQTIRADLTPPPHPIDKGTIGINGFLYPIMDDYQVGSVLSRHVISPRCLMTMEYGALDGLSFEGGVGLGNIGSLWFIENGVGNTFSTQFGIVLLGRVKGRILRSKNISIGYGVQGLWMPFLHSKSGYPEGDIQWFEYNIFSGIYGEGGAFRPYIDIFWTQTFGKLSLRGINEDKSIREDDPIGGVFGAEYWWNKFSLGYGVIFRNDVTIGIYISFIL